MKELSDIRDSKLPLFASLVSGKIQLFGKTIEHEHGYRGQFAKVLHLYRNSICGVCSSPIEIGENGIVGLVHSSTPQLQFVDEIYCKDCTKNTVEDSKEGYGTLIEIFVGSKTFGVVDLSSWSLISSSRLRALYDSLVKLYTTD